MRIATFIAGTIAGFMAGWVAFPITVAWAEGVIAEHAQREARKRLRRFRVIDGGRV